MFRNLVIIVLLGLLVWLINRIFLKPKRRKSKPAPMIEKNMVQCEQCGVFLPEQQAVVQHGHRFCSRKHVEDWEETHSP